ncbi:MAG: hypothetical protein ABRQ39_29945, partial [Candidatus Eremiobacterota bacterium]
IAIWWTSENGQKIRHREERVIDFFDSDLTGFNFGVPPPPTATPTFPPPTDKYYDIVTEKIIAQKVKWQQELGWKEGLKKTADWLNGQVPEVPGVRKRFV